MQGRFYIQVILPLKLGWEPWYCSSESIETGMRVRVSFAGKEYVAVTSRVTSVPGIPEEKVRPVVCVETGLDRISSEELALWRFIASYYLCTMGEVYRTAYPVGKQTVEARKPRKKASADENGSNGIDTEIDFNDRKPVLLLGGGRKSVYDAMVRRTLASGRDVLMIRPDAESLSYAQLRDLAKEVRSTSAKAQLIVGRRSSVFLPFAKLGLVIVDEEQDAFYKQNDPAPRFNARDVAVVLAKIHGADIVLGSSCPSLESLYNAVTGKYRLVELDGWKNGVGAAEVEVVDVTEEKRKRGMHEERSVKLEIAEEQVRSAGGKILEINSWEIRKSMKMKLERYSLVAVFHGEFLLSKDDYRADEKALQLFAALRDRCRGTLFVQTLDARHPVFRALQSATVSGACSELLAERAAFRLPPYTRQIDIVLKDRNEDRLARMEKAASAELGPLSQYFPKDAGLQDAKEALKEKVSDFCERHKYIGFIHLDVDPC